MMGTCKNCIWWSVESIYNIKSPSRTCRCPKNVQDCNSFPEHDGAGDLDVGCISTGPDFDALFYALQRRASDLPDGTSLKMSRHQYEFLMRIFTWVDRYNPPVTFMGHAVEIIDL